MREIFETLHRSSQANQIALDAVGRNQYPTLAVVCDIDDPENERRIKVADPASPQVTTYWLRRLFMNPFIDPPLPEIGDTVLCLWVEGDPNNGYYLSLGNATNPPQQKNDPALDHYYNVPGKYTETVGKAKTEKTAEDHTISVGYDYKLSNERGNKIDLLQDGDRNDFTPKNLTITAGENLIINNLAGASVTLTVGGAVVITSSSGATIVLGGVTGGVPGIGSDFFMQLNNPAQWDLSGQTLNFVNASDVKINGKSILTIDSVDSAGDISVTRGY